MATRLVIMATETLFFSAYTLTSGHLCNNIEHVVWYEPFLFIQKHFATGSTRLVPGRMVVLAAARATVCHAKVVSGGIQHSKTLVLRDPSSGLIILMDSSLDTFSWAMTSMPGHLARA